MPYDIFGAAQSLVGGVGSLMEGQAMAAGSAASAKFYGKAAQYAELETGIKEQMASRQIYQTIGQAKAAVGASGLAESGSAADIMRSSAQQGALTKELLQTQGNIEVSSYQAQQQAALAAAKAQKTGGTMGMIGGVIGALGSLFSDDKLKTDIELVRCREDGLSIYRFRFGGQGPVFEGVLASEVEKLFPAAVQYDDSGTRRILYDMIGVEFKQVGSVV